MAAAADFIGVGPCQHLDHMIDSGAELAGSLNPINAGEEFLREHGAVVGFTWLQTIVACTAFVERKSFAEVGEQLASPAARAFGVVHCLAKLGARDLLLLSIGDFLNEMSLLCRIACAKEQEAIAR